MSPILISGLKRLFAVSQGFAAAKAQGGLVGRLKQAGWAMSGAATFARLYLRPVLRHDLPQQVRMAPAW